MTPALEATHAQVERILQSLRLSEVQRRLLLYLVEKSLAGEADDLKEYTIGVDAFGKPPSYDPRPLPPATQEPAVPAEAGRIGSGLLRKRARVAALLVMIASAGVYRVARGRSGANQRRSVHNVASRVA